jgi:hypothetical protein
MDFGYRYVARKIRVVCRPSAFLSIFLEKLNYGNI